MSKDLISGFLHSLLSFSKEIGSRNIECIIMYDLKFVYGDFDKIVVIFCIDKHDSTEKVLKKIHRVAEAFLMKYHEIIHHPTKALRVSLYRDFETDLNLAIKSTIKIILLGESGVGKTTMFKLLKGDEIPIQHLPTMGPTINEIKLAGDVQMVVWDTPGQRLYHNIWSEFLLGADIIFLVTDSKADNVSETKNIYTRYILKGEENTHWYCIANKQDLPDALKPDEIKNLVGVPTFGMIAIDNSPDNRKNFENMLKKVISEKIGQDILQMEEKISDEKNLTSIIEQIERLKEHGLQHFDLSDPMLWSMNFWIDKLKNYVFPQLSSDDLKILVETRKEWLEKIRSRISETEKPDEISA